MAESRTVVLKYVDALLNLFSFTHESHSECAQFSDVLLTLHRSPLLCAVNSVSYFTFVVGHYWFKQMIDAFMDNPWKAPQPVWACSKKYKDEKIAWKKGTNGARSVSIAWTSRSVRESWQPWWKQYFSFNCLLTPRSKLPGNARKEGKARATSMTVVALLMRDTRCVWYES